MMRSENVVVPEESLEDEVEVLRMPNTANNVEVIAYHRDRDEGTAPPSLGTTVVDESKPPRDMQDVNELSPAGPTPPASASDATNRRPTALRKVIRRVSSLFLGSNDSEDPASPRRRSHYRRGSILLKHLEHKQTAGKATEKDVKFFETMKAKFDANKLEARTMISLSIFQTGGNPLDDPFAVMHMPIEIQQGFRQKLFAIFSIQLLVVVILIFILTYVPFLEALFVKNFHTWYSVAITFAIMVVALIWLYFVKYNYPLNFVILVLYTLTQSIFFVAADTFFKTVASIFVFILLFFVMAITTLLSSIVSKRSVGDPAASVLISYPMALLAAFFIAFVGSLFVYFFWLEQYLSAFQYSASLASLLLLIMWFAYDASCMNERLSPDEYMQGMVFFYTDMVLFLIFLSIIFVACFACESDCACYGTADIAPFGVGGGGNGEEGDDGGGGEGGGEAQ